MKVIRSSLGEIDGKEHSQSDIGDATPSVRWALASLALAMLLPSLGTSIANVALPTLAEIFAASFQEMQWVVLAYLLTTTALIVSVGRLGDIIGRHRLLLIGLLLFTIASLVCGITPVLWLLILGRAIQGLGAAIMLALSMSYVGDTVPKEKTGSVMGLLGTMSAIGTALGPSIGGFLISGFGWRTIFFINVPLGFLAIFLAYRFLPVDHLRRDTSQGGFDKVGTLLLALTLSAYALSMSINTANFGAINIMLLLLVVVGGVLFVLAETKVASPLIQLLVFRDPQLDASLAMNALVATVMMTTLVVGPFYLSIALGLDEVLVGLVMSIGPIVSAISGIPAGRIVDRFGASVIVIAGIVEMLLGAFALAILPMMFNVVGYIVAMVILTPGYQMFLAANNTDVMMDVHSDQRGVISGMLNLSRNLGLITGTAVMGAVFAIASKTTDITTAPPDAVAGGMQITFLVSGGLIVLALMIALGGRILSKRTL